MNSKLVWAFLLGAGLVALIMFLVYGRPATVNPPQTAAQEQGPAPSPTGEPEPGPSPRPANEPPAVKPAVKPAAEPAARPPREQSPVPRTPAQPKAPAEVTVLAGTLLKAALESTLTSHESHAGDTFTLKVMEPVVVAGYTAIPAGATVQGKVVDAKGSGRISGHGEITLAFESVTDVNGAPVPIDAGTFYGKAAGAGTRDAAIIAGGTAAGAVIGGIAGKTKGAVIGGLIGAAAGTGTVLATKGPEVKLTPGSVFGIQLNASLHVPAGPKAGS